MNAEYHIEKAREIAAHAPNFRDDDLTPADCYARANYHLLLALLERTAAS